MRLRDAIGQCGSTRTAVGVADHLRRQRRIEPLPAVHHQARHRHRAAFLEVGVVGLRLIRCACFGHMHEEQLRRFVAERTQPVHAARVQIDQTDAFARGEVAHGQRVEAVRIEQLPSIELAPRHRRDQDRRRAALARQRDVACQPRRERIARFVVAGRVFELRVVVAELHQQHVARAQVLRDAVQPALLDEAARAAPALRVVAYRPGFRVEEGLQLHPPALARRALGAVVAGGGITGDEHATRRRLGDAIRRARIRQRCARQAQREHDAHRCLLSAPASRRRRG